MAVTPLNAAGISRNKAFDSSTGAAADPTNFNSFPNNGKTFLVITTGATPGTVSLAVSRKVDGKSVADVPVLDTAGAALAASKTYIVGIGSAADYGDIVTVKATQNTTKILVFQV